jgi:hypothetical protein
MNDERNQGRARSNWRRSTKGPSALYSAVQGVRCSIVALVRSWVRGGIVTDLNEVAAELNHRAVPLLIGKKANSGMSSSRYCGRRRQICSPKSERPRRHYRSYRTRARSG